MAIVDLTKREEKAKTIHPHFSFDKPAFLLKAEPQIILYAVFVACLSSRTSVLNISPEAPRIAIRGAFEAARPRPEMAPAMDRHGGK
jgi:hypothetical protein